MAEIRYMVDDVDQAVAFYCTHLGFELVEQYGPAMAILDRGDLTLWLAGPKASARKPMPDGALPVPGGWARFVLRVADIEATVAALTAAGAAFRNDILAGPGGRQCLVQDPSGNLVELFQPA
jgi:catechol 2,3-dioxygenase-like lactoylglutathione lyase family enzyme